MSSLAPRPKSSVRPVTRSELIALVGRFLSVITTRGLVDRALSDASVHGEEVPSDKLPAIKRAIEDGLRIFVAGPAREISIQALRSIDGSTVPSPFTATIEEERDVQNARLAARVMCGELGGTSLVAQRISTSVSELSRNILLYARGLGSIEIVPLLSPRKSILVRAVDRGPGIAQIADVLGGRYQSKTGLGRGLLGVKRLSDRFEISTGGSGTRVEAETWL